MSTVNNILDSFNKILTKIDTNSSQKEACSELKNASNSIFDEKADSTKGEINLNTLEDEMLPLSELQDNYEEPISFFEKGWGRIKDLFDKDTKDGKIGNFKQGQTNDCYLLSSVNAIAASEKGREMIKDALEYNENGTTVHLKGIGDYEVSNKELAHTKGVKQYSRGDDDMIIFELAVQKALDDLKGTDTKISTAALNIPEITYIQETTKDKASIDYGGMDTLVLHLITGKAPDNVKNKEEISDILEQYKENSGQDMALTASMQTGTTIKDINDEEVSLTGPHAYSIENVDEDTVTMVDPWDSSKKNVIDKETFIETIDAVCECDLSDDNKEVNLLSKGEKDENGDYTYTFNIEGKYETIFTGQDTSYTKVIDKYRSNELIKDKKYFDKDNNLKMLYTYSGVPGKYDKIDFLNNSDFGIKVNFKDNKKDVFSFVQTNENKEIINELKFELKDWDTIKSTINCKPGMSYNEIISDLKSQGVLN